MKIINKTRNTIIANNVVVARGALQRMQGLLGKKSIAYDKALVIEKCNSVHTFFMQFAIDVLFVDKNNKIVGICPALKPWRLSPVFLKASFVIELPAGTIFSAIAQIGDIIFLERIYK